MIPGEYSWWSDTLTILCAYEAAYEMSTSPHTFITTQKNPVGRIYLTWGRICLTWAGCQVFGIDEKVRLGQIYPTMLTRQGIKRFPWGLSTPITFNNSVVSLLIVRHAYDSQININNFLSQAHHLLFFFLFPIIHDLIFNVLLFNTYSKAISSLICLSSFIQNPQGA
jgi:ABC-type polysaccharide transport system permease subunit